MVARVSYPKSTSCIYTSIYLSRSLIGPFPVPHSALHSDSHSLSLTTSLATYTSSSDVAASSLLLSIPIPIFFLLISCLWSAHFSCRLHVMNSKSIYPYLWINVPFSSPVFSAFVFVRKVYGRSLHQPECGGWSRGGSELSRHTERFSRAQGQHTHPKASQIALHNYSSLFSPDVPRLGRNILRRSRAGWIADRRSDTTPNRVCSHPSNSDAAEGTGDWWATEQWELLKTTVSIYRVFLSIFFCLCVDTTYPTSAPQPIYQQLPPSTLDSRLQTMFLRHIGLTPLHSLRDRLCSCGPCSPIVRTPANLARRMRPTEGKWRSRGSEKRVLLEVRDAEDCVANALKGDCDGCDECGGNAAWEEEVPGMDRETKGDPWDVAK